MKKRNIIITGGSSGIGLAAVHRFLETEDQVFVLDKKPIPFVHTNLHYYSCDVSDITQIEKTVQQLTQKHDIQHIDVLVCNAGIHFSATVEDSSEEDYERVMSTNFKGTFFLTKQTLPFMKAKGGSIVLVGSDQTIIGKKHSALYGASKAALGSFSKTTALDYAPYNIRVNLIAAGTIDTPLYQEAVQRYCKKTGKSLESVHQAEAKEQPLGRIGTTGEVASLIQYLCTEDACFMTGAIIPMDGGYTAQ